MDWLGTLKTLAPTVATALGGPLAGVAVSALGSLFGVPEATQQSLAKFIQDGQVTPEHLAALRELEMRYQNDEKERGFKYSELAYKDVASARDLATKTQSQVPAVLTFVIIFGGGGMLASVLYGYAKADSVLAGTLIGYAVSEMKQVLQFWFGASARNPETDQILLQSTPPTK